LNKPGAYLQAFAGHLIDLYWLNTFHFANPHSYSKLSIINAVRKKTGARMMIESGTYRGVTAARCARLFEKDYTIELDKDLAAGATEYLRGCANVEVIQGDALVELPRILARSEVHDLLVFLDGHFSGGETAMGDLAEPAVEEIKALGAFRDKVRAVVVDDFRSFGVEKGWPSKSSLIQSFERHLGDMDLIVHMDQVIATSTRG
jgi:hypothetical protein